MKQYSFLVFCLLVLVGSISIIGESGCANIMPPYGGLRDSLPPIMVHAAPLDSSKNFTEKRIVLTFDEFIQLDNIHDNLIVSPLPKLEPAVESKLRTLTIRLKDTLEPNTTYTLNFGKAIKDVNEGNIARNFTYLFSTGPVFDSLSLSGRVLLAETGKADSTLMVMLHQHGDDSAVVNEKPRYLARLDSTGRFTFRNLPAGTFYLYALDDQGGAHRYSSGKQAFAFADSPVVISSNNQPITLYAYTEEPSSTTAKGPQVSFRQKGGSNSPDKQRFRLQTNLTNGEQDLLTSLTISTDLPLRKLDTTLIAFRSDSTFTPVTGYHLTLDTTNKKLVLEYKWKENTRYHLIIDKDFAEDTLGRKLLKADTINFTTKKLSDYGSLKLRFRNLDLSVNPVLEFVQSNTVMKLVPMSTSEVSLPLFLPGEYDLRILSDRNKNGKWDTGEFLGKHLQPEIVKLVKRKISVKPDWQNEFDIQLD